MGSKVGLATRGGTADQKKTTQLVNRTRHPIAARINRPLSRVFLIYTKRDTKNV